MQSIKEIKRRSYLKNRDKNLQYAKKYREENRQLVQFRTSKWRDKNKDRISAQKKSKRIYTPRVKLPDGIRKQRATLRWRAWREKNPDSHRKHTKNWAAKNRDTIRVYTANRRNRIRQNGGTLSKDIVSVLHEKQQGKCNYCPALFKNTKFHLDHIIPIAKAGRNEDGNVQLLCQTCNLKKGTKLSHELTKLL